MKKIIILAIIALLILVALPLVVVLFIGSMDAMGIAFLLLFTINPLAAIIIGVLSYGDNKILWYLPAVYSVVFLVAESAIMTFDIVWLAAAVIYAALGFAAAFITKAVKNKK